jgi:mRNA-degrading endonuclease RelE of RelBE toxin-antitoxin system
MDFRIADTFTDSLARLTGEEQKAVKTTAFDLQLDPKSPGMKFHRLDKAKDKNFWSVRVSSDLRLIVHRTDASLLLCFVGHHDKAYDWAERRRLEVHPKTGAMQLVELRETLKEIVVPVYVQQPVPAKARKKAASPAASKPVLVGVKDEDLLGYGVPAEWLDDVKSATEDTLLALADHLPAEAAEALLELATGGTPRMPQPVAATASPFDHPDAQRRFRVMNNVEELQRALEFPWDKWTVFLHPEQQQWVAADFHGPARVGGSAGTGKTIVALHRAVHLARANPEARVLLTTFSDALANALRERLKRLLGSEPRLAERIDVHSLPALGLRLHKVHVGKASIVGRGVLQQILGDAAAAEPKNKFSLHFLLTEWDQVVMRGSSAAGSRTAMSRGSAGRRGYRSRRGRCCGRSSNGCVPSWARGSC